MELWGVLVGGLIAAVAGLIGLTYNRKTEHRQWLRGQRQEKYTEFLSIYESRRKVLIEWSLLGEWSIEDSRRWLEYDAAGLILVAPDAVSVPVVEAISSLEKAMATIYENKPRAEYEALFERARVNYRQTVRQMTKDLQR
jgi:hypothetical protein